MCDIIVWRCRLTAIVYLAPGYCHILNQRLCHYDSRAEVLNLNVLYYHLVIAASIDNSGVCHIRIPFISPRAIRICHVSLQCISRAVDNNVVRTDNQAAFGSIRANHVSIERA